MPRHFSDQRTAVDRLAPHGLPQPWFGGAYVWKWESYPNHGDEKNSAFSVEHKPAEDVVRRLFSAP